MLLTADKSIPSYKSKPEEWIAWYELIPGGRSTRNSLWLMAWSKYGSAEANTAALREYMRNNAGIELTTNGIGNVIDGALGIKDSIEDVAMVPLYILGGAMVMFFGLAGFVAYQAIKNPDAAGKFVGTATRVAVTKKMAFGGTLGLNKKTAMYAAGASSLAIMIVLIYMRYCNQTIVNNIVEALGKNTDPIIGNKANYGDIRDLSMSQIFTPSWWRTNPNKVTIWFSNANGSAGPAQKLAKQIWEAKSTSDLTRFQIKDYPENVVAAFKTLKSKEDVSKLADVFEAMYKKNLWNFINDSFMTNNCGPDQENCFLGLAHNHLYDVYHWITNQLT